MKTKQSITKLGFVSAFIILSLSLFQCSNKVEVFSVTGTVTYATGIPADGAIVTITSDAEQTVVVNNVVCSENGEYTLYGLVEGTYYLSSHYNTANLNNLKAAGYTFKTSEPVMVELAEDKVQDIQLVNEPGGDDKISTTDGTWRFDKAHSNVNWATAYMGQNAELTGKFNIFDVSINFDEANPEATTIEAWVQLSTANTGEPGRDDLGKCLNGYLGVATDTLDDGTYYVSDPLTDTAFFSSTSVVVWGDGYKAAGSMEFKGISKPVELLFNYIGQADFSTEQDGSNVRGGFNGEFHFNAISDYEVSSTSIADLVRVSINANYRKN